MQPSTSTDRIGHATRQERFDRVVENHMNRVKEKKPPMTTMQAKVYNFLERPTGWGCFAYHFSV